MTDRCDVCGREVTIAGGITNFWTLDHTETGGLTLELQDGSEHFLCFECIERLPEDATAADVADLRADAAAGSENDAAESAANDAADAAEDGSSGDPDDGER